jgi:hypothetical protein
MPADNSAVTPGWCLLHIGFEGDDVSVAGINPWKVTDWTSTGERIVVAHPSYPAQRHHGSYAVGQRWLSSPVNLIQYSRVEGDALLPGITGRIS